MLVELTKSAALLVIAGISKYVIFCFFSSARVWWWRNQYRRVLLVIWVAWYVRSHADVRVRAWKGHRRHRYVFGSIGIYLFDSCKNWSPFRLMPEGDRDAREISSHRTRHVCHWIHDAVLITPFVDTDLQAFFDYGKWFHRRSCNNYSDIEWILS